MSKKKAKQNFKRVVCYCNNNTISYIVQERLKVRFKFNAQILIRFDSRRSASRQTIERVRRHILLL